MNNPLKAGITGGIGAGKSIVCRIFEVLGIPIYNADSQAKRLMNEDPVVKSKMLDFFGPDAYKNNLLNREWIANETFSDPEKVKKLNAIVHPAVAESYKHWVNEQKSPYTLKEAALIYEAGSYKELDCVIVVSAPVDIRIDRVLKRDLHRKKSDVEAIIERQLSEEEKIKRADYVIYNDGSQLILPQALAIDQELRRLAGK